MSPKFILLAVIFTLLTACAAPPASQTSPATLTPIIEITKTPTQTPTPAPRLPQNLSDIKDQLEQAGYVFEFADGGMALVDTDEDGNSTEVMSFPPDGSIAIKGLGLDFQRADKDTALLLTPDQMEREGIRIVSSPGKDGSGFDVHIEKDKGNGEYEKAAKYVDAKNAWLGTPDITAENLKYGEKELADFDGNLQIKAVTVGGEEMQGLVGIKADGSEQILGLEGIEAEAKMTRVGHYVDPSGHSVFAYLKDGYNIDGRLEVTPGTPENIFELWLQSMAAIRTGSTDISVNKKMAETIREEVWKNGGMATFRIPTSQYNDYYIRWKQVTVDFNKPIEVAAIASEEEYWNLPPELRELAIDHDTGPNRDPTGKEAYGSIMGVGEEEQLLIYAIDTYFKADYGNPQSAEEKKFAARGLQIRMGGNVLYSVDFIRKVGLGHEALWRDLITGSQKPHYVVTRSRDLFKYIPTPKNSTSQ